MKKLTIMACVIGFLMSVMPIKVSAADYSNTISTRYGKIDIEWEYTDADNGIKTWKFYLTPNSSFKTFMAEVQPSNTIEIQSLNINESNFLDGGTEKTSTGTKVVLLSTNPNGMTNGTKVLLFTVTTKDTGDKGCYLNISPQGVPNCVIVGNNYYDKNGNNVTKAEYDKACSNVTPTNPTDDPNDIPETPPTGSVIPYIAVGGGLLAIAGVYFFSRKSNKMYKI